MYRSILLVVAALVALLVVGCVAPASSSPVDNTPAPSGGESPAVTPDTGTSPVATPAAGSTGGLSPDVADRAIEWLATEASVAVADLRLVEAERTEWTDSCFGLGGPAESCLAAMTPGWRIVFEAGGEQYEVRTDEAGTNFRVTPQAS
jgi:hypothetical protein